MQDSNAPGPTPAAVQSLPLTNHPAVIGLCLFLLTVGVYLPAIENQFVNWDDTGYVTKNPRVAGGISPAGLYYAWTTFDVGNWIPLTWMSYQLDATLFGVNPVAFHGVNILLHAINVVLVFLSLKRLTGSNWRSAIVAAFFGIHPLHVESVAWVSERKDLLSTCALLCILLLYDRYAMRPNFLRMTAVCVAFACGLLAKSMLVSVPILLLLIDFWPLRRWPSAENRGCAGESGRNYPIRTSRQLLFEKLPLCLLAAFECLMTVVAQWDSAVIALQSATLYGRLLNAVDSVRWYLSKTFAPWDLCAFYPHPGALDLDWIEHSMPRFRTSMVIILLISIIVMWRQRRDITFGWFWFLISLLPVIGLIQVGSQAYADRYTYIPHIGLFVALVWPAHRCIAKTVIGRWIAIAIAMGCLIACGQLSRTQISTWRNSETLWRHAVELDPTNIFARLKLGSELLDQKRSEEAEIQFSQALRHFPNFDLAIYYLGIIQEIRGDEKKAAAYFEWLLRIHPNHQAAMQHLAYLYQRQKPSIPPTISDAVREEIDQGARKGSRIARQRNWSAAIVHFERAIELDKNCGAAYRFAGDALEELGRLDEARQYFAAAVQIESLDVEACHAMDRLAQKKLNSK